MKKKIILFLFLLIFTKVSAQNFVRKDSITFYHGYKVNDAYRALEDLNDSLVLKWLKQQESKTQSILQKIPNRARLVQLQHQLSHNGSVDIKSVFVTKNREYIFLKRQENDQHHKLYFRNSLDSKDKLLYDPIDFEKTESNYYIDFISPSWDDKKVMISFARNGNEFSKIRILNLVTQKFLPIKINATSATFFNPYWLPDNSGIVYVRFPLTKEGKDAYLNTEAVIHKIGKEPYVVLSRVENPSLGIQPKDFPVLLVDSPENKYILSFIAGAAPYNDAFYISAKDIYKDHPKWRPLFTKEEQVKSTAQLGDSLLYLTSKDASNFKICKTSLKKPNFQNSKILISEKDDETITSFELTKSGMFYTATKNGIEAKLYFYNNDGIRKELELPFKAGNIKIKTNGIQNDFLSIRIEGWLHREARYEYDFNKQVFIPADLDFNFSNKLTHNLIAKEVLVSSHDSITVPLSLIYNKNLKKEGNTPVFMIGYGSYGAILSPSFSEKIISWALEGGIFAVAHVRGGGEKGDAWYKGGFKHTKPNTWKDMIACAEYLIKNNFTTSDNIAIHGGSAGGITVGRAMTERPDLFQAVISSVGTLNPVLAETGINGENNTKEFGTVKDPLEFESLYKMDSFFHVEKGESYPATLITTGFNDSRVPPWHSAKFAAKLMDFNISNNPILLNVDFSSGHGDNTKEKRLNSVTDILSFAFWQTGHPDYQPFKED